MMPTRHVDTSIAYKTAGDRGKSEIVEQEFMSLSTRACRKIGLRRFGESRRQHPEQIGTRCHDSRFRRGELCDFVGDRFGRLTECAASDFATTSGTGSRACCRGGGFVGVTAADNRRFVEAVLYRYRAGIPWRDLPERLGDWKNVHRRFSRGRIRRVGEGFPASRC